MRVPALICLGAQRADRRARPGSARDAGRGDVRGHPGKTKLAPASCWSSILLPPAQPRSAAGYLRFTPRREMDIAVAGAGAWLRLDADGAIAEARLVLASVAPTPIARSHPPSGKLLGRAAGAARCSRRPGRLAAQGRAPDLGYARLGRLSPHARRRADRARARRLRPAARHRGRVAMKTLAHLHREWRGAQRARRHARHAARAAARPARPHRHQGRLRQRQLRHLHGAGGRRAGQCLPDAGARGAGPRHRHHRGPRARRRAASDAAGARRARRHAMRLLHAGHRAVRQGAARRATREPSEARHPPRHRRQPVPLHRLRQDRRGHRGRRARQREQDAWRPKPRSRGRRTRSSASGCRASTPASASPARRVYPADLALPGMVHARARCAARTRMPASAASIPPRAEALQRRAGGRDRGGFRRVPLGATHSDGRDRLRHVDGGADQHGAPPGALGRPAGGGGRRGRCCTSPRRRWR